MLALPKYEGETAVFGLGQSGLACVRALCAADNRVVAWDDNPARCDTAQANGAVLRDLVADFGAPSRLVLSPGVPLTHPEPHRVVRAARDAKVPILGDVALLHDALQRDSNPPSVVAVTGTNGKSTVTALIAYVLTQCGVRACAAGNIGVPIVDIDSADMEILVAELSSYQIDLMGAFCPTLAVLTNITPDHLDRHGGMAGYVAAKTQLFDALDKKGYAVIVEAGAYESAIADALSARGVRVTRIGCDAARADILYDADWFAEKNGARISLADNASLAGAHNAQNAALAFAVARYFGVAATAIEEALNGFAGLAHRLEYVGGRRIRFVNDSKATNAEATRHALRAYENIFWIVGGRAKAGGIETLKGELENITRAYLIGESAADFAAQLPARIMPKICAGLEEAVAQAITDARKENRQCTILLSPSAASFDQFANFEARGDAFKHIALRWLGGEGAGQ